MPRIHFGFGLDGSSSAGSGTNPLLIDLSGHWRLDEASGTRADATGSHPLTDNLFVGQAAGKIGQAAVFNGLTQHLSAASTSELQTGDISYSFSAWIYLTDISTLRTVASKGNAIGFTVEYVFYVDPSDGCLHCQVWNDPPSASDQAISLAPIPLNTWTHMVFIRDKDAGQNKLYVNGAAQDNSAIVNTPVAHDGNFELGRYGILLDRYWHGRIDSVWFWQRAITADEVAEIWNDGVGLDYPF